jgi:hypothetical protein
MLRLKHCAEWLYYGMWYVVAWHTLELMKRMKNGSAWNKQPFLWIVQQGWVWGDLYTLAERREMEGITSRSLCSHGR